jgi:hypothetical protein
VNLKEQKAENKHEYPENEQDNNFYGKIGFSGQVHMSLFGMSVFVRHVRELPLVCL